MSSATDAILSFPTISTAFTVNDFSSLATLNAVATFTVYSTTSFTKDLVASVTEVAVFPVATWLITVCSTPPMKTFSVADCSAVTVKVTSLTFVKSSSSKSPESTTYEVIVGLTDTISMLPVILLPSPPISVNKL